MMMIIIIIIIITIIGLAPFLLRTLLTRIWARNSEGEMTSWLETLIELKILNSSFSSLSSY